MVMLGIRLCVRVGGVTSSSVIVIVEASLSVLGVTLSRLLLV